MKITIDTKEDSHAEIQHAISLLQTLMQKRHHNAFDATDQAANAMACMFGDNSDLPASDAINEAATASAMSNILGGGSSEPSAPASASMQSEMTEPPQDFGSILDQVKEEIKVERY